MVEMQVQLRYRWVILGVALMSQVTVALGVMALGPLAPLFQPELGLSKTGVGLLTSASSAGSWSLLLVAGSLTDRFGVRTMLSLGQVATGALLLLMALAGSVLQAAAVMFMVGIGGAVALPGSTKAVREWFPPACRATAMGLKQTGTPVAGILTAFLLPALGLTFGWRVALSALGLVTIAGGVVAAYLYRDPPHQRDASGGGVSIREGLKAVVRSRPLWTVGSVGLLFMALQFGLMTYLALYFNEVVLVPSVPDERSRVIAAGGFLAISQMGGLFGRIFWGVVSDRLFGGQRRMVLGIIGALSGLGALALAQLEPGYAPWLMSAIVLVTGTCIVGWNGVYHAAITETVSPEYAATAVGLSMTMLMVGMTLGPPLFGFVVDTSGSYRAGWLFLGCIGAGAGLLAFLTGKMGGKG